MDAKDLEEHRNRMYTTIVKSSTFALQLKTYNMYYSDSKLNQQLQVVQEDGTFVLLGMLKIYWGTQKVIRLKKEELSWKRRSARLPHGLVLDEKMLDSAGSRSTPKRSPIRLRGSVYETFGKTPSGEDRSAEEGAENGAGDGPSESERVNEFASQGPRNSDPFVDYWNGSDVNPARRRRVVASVGEEEEDSFSVAQPGAMPGKANLQRRTMSFSGHLYNSKTAVFRPKYGTVSNVRVSSRHTTSDVISLLLQKFAVENQRQEFDLYWVLHNGETHAFQPNDFPLLKRVQLGPAEDVAKIFLKERQSDEVSPEAAQFVNLRFSELNAIFRKFEEEEEKEIYKIRQRYVQYKATLEKKLSSLSAEIASKETSKSKTKFKGKEKKKGKDKNKDKK